MKKCSSHCNVCNNYVNEEMQKKKNVEDWFLRKILIRLLDKRRCGVDVVTFYVPTGVLLSSSGLYSTNE